MHLSVSFIAWFLLLIGVFSVHSADKQGGLQGNVVLRQLNLEKREAHENSTEGTIIVSFKEKY